jgi:hypothetical protein
MDAAAGGSAGGATVGLARVAPHAVADVASATPRTKNALDTIAPMAPLSRPPRGPSGEGYGREKKWFPKFRRRAETGSAAARNPPPWGLALASRMTSMRSILVLGCALALGGCSRCTHETGTSDTASPYTGSADASEGGCPTGWLVPPAVVASLAVPADGGVLRIHVSATGTQNYVCTPTDAGAAWTLTGPTATLDDCTSALYGHHFTSDGGAALPEWQAADGTYVVGRKVAAFTPDGGSGSVPWLLLQVVGSGGSGPLARSLYVQRLDTKGGVATGACDAGATQLVDYGADYYFYGP